MTGALGRTAGRGAAGRGAGSGGRRRTGGAGRAGAGGGAAGAGRGGDRRAVPGGRGRVPGPARPGRTRPGRRRRPSQPARITPRLSRSVPVPTLTRRPGSPPGNNPRAQHAAAGTPGESERRRGLHSGSPDPVDPLAGVITGPVGRSGPHDGGSGQPRGLRRDCGSWSRNCASHASPRRCSWDSPTYVAALRWIAARSASDTSRRTLPGTPATSTPSGTCCPSASTVPAATIA